MYDLLFLDIDGVLNNHTKHPENEYCGINDITLLNYILHATDCRLVISSAWRYMIHGEAMTILGFEYLLRTHGLTDKIPDVIHGITRKDRDPAYNEDRADAILEYLSKLPEQPANYCCVDDLDLGYTVRRLPHVLTTGNRGLSIANANEVIRILNNG